MRERIFQSRTIATPSTTKEHWSFAILGGRELWIGPSRSHARSRFRRSHMLTPRGTPPLWANRCPKSRVLSCKLGLAILTMHFAPTVTTAPLFDPRGALLTFLKERQLHPYRVT